MEWYSIIFEVIDMRSFSNLWYWIMLAVMWSSASHWVLGVPFDMIARARKHGGTLQDDLETIVRIYSGRMLSMARAAGLLMIGLLCFVITVLAILGLVYDVEFAQAILFLIVPMTLLALMSLRTARLIEAGENSGAVLHRRLLRHRVSTQALGMVSIFVTSIYGMWQNMHIGLLS